MTINTAMNVCVVDDDAFFLSVYKEYLRTLGLVNISVFDNGIDCINSLAAKTDIVFLDYNMDKLNGMEVLKRIKHSHPALYVVFLSGQEDIQVALDSFANGAYEYIIKGKNDMAAIEQVLKKISTAAQLAAEDKRNVVF